MSSLGGLSSVIRIGTVAVSGKSGDQIVLGLPTSGAFASGLVALTNASLITDAIDGINAALLQVDQKTGALLLIGAPTSGDFSGGDAMVAETDTIADAVDKVNVALANVRAGLGSLQDRVGWIRIVDLVVPGGTVSARVYDDPPNNTILQAATVSNGSFSVVVEASFPRVSIGANNFILPLVGSIYRGSLPITLGSSGDISAELTDPDSNPGAIDTVSVTIDEPAQVTSALFANGYPGSQTSLKEGDTFDLTIAADGDFDQIIVDDFGASSGQTFSVPQGQLATVTVPIADRGNSPTPFAARVQVRDAVNGALSSQVLTSDFSAADGEGTVVLNNTRPTVVLGAISYPPSQAALKGSESASVALSLADFDTFQADSPNSQLSIDGAVASQVDVSRIAGSYNVTVANLRVRAQLAENASETEDTAVVAIANVAAQVSAAVPFARLRSGGNDGTSVPSYTVTLTADQELISAPVLEADSGGSRGTFLGAFVGGPSVWTRQLQVSDNDEKGVFDFESFAATNLAGIPSSALAAGEQYELGGFVQRSVTFAPFQDQASIDVLLVDFAKLQAGIFTSTNGQSSKQPIGTPSASGQERPNQYTVVSAGVKPTILRWLDTAAVNANSSGLAQLVDIEEIV